MFEPDWEKGLKILGKEGVWEMGAVLDAETCEMFVRTYEKPAFFRSRVIMSRHQFGQGEYKYFDYPLSAEIEMLRNAWYPRFQTVANDWSVKLGFEKHYPDSLPDYRLQCRNAGQEKATPLLLKYEAGDYNCLHQDLYGVEQFPIQVAICLSEPGDDFEGGEFVLTQQRPRMQSRVNVYSPKRGQAIAFAVNVRPEAGKRGFYQVKMRHGVSPVHRGRRFVLGLIFHDAT